MIVDRGRFVPKTASTLVGRAELYAWKPDLPYQKVKSNIADFGVSLSPCTCTINYFWLHDSAFLQFGGGTYILAEHVDFINTSYALRRFNMRTYHSTSHKNETANMFV